MFVGSLYIGRKKVLVQEQSLVSHENSGNKLAKAYSCWVSQMGLLVSVNCPLDLFIFTIQYNFILTAVRAKHLATNTTIELFNFPDSKPNVCPQLKQPEAFLESTHCGSFCHAGTLTSDKIPRSRPVFAL